MSLDDDLERHLAELLEAAEEHLEALDIGATLEDEPIRSVRFELAGADALVMADGIEYGGRILTALIMVVAVHEGVTLSPRERLRENATAGLGWYTDREGRWGLRDGIPGDPLEPTNLQARVHEARQLVAARPLAAPDIAGPDSLASIRALLEGVGMAVTALPNALGFATPAGPAELRIVIRDGAVATVVWVEVGRSQRPGLEDLLLTRNRVNLREGSLALTPDGRVVMRGWLAGEPTSFEQIARLLAPLLTSATELRPMLEGD